MWNEEERSNSEDYSASATVIPFNPPLPLLRAPLPAGLSDDPSIGPFVLAFKDSKTWKSSLQTSHSKIRLQCEGGARIGCSISASSKCKPPWWKTTLFGSTTIDFSERERCEEREMSACIASSKESCRNFAKDKCLIPFREARISTISQKEVSKCISRAFPKSALLNTSSQSNGQELFSICGLEVTNYRGSALLDSETGTEDYSM